MPFPTQLTLWRVVLTFLMLPFLFEPGWAAKTIALAIFVTASLTDWLDGYLARRWRQTTPLGALLDPIADKVLVLGTFLAFVQLTLVPAWMVLVIALREFLITGVRLFAASRQIVLAAAKEGKHKTVSQIVTILVIFAALIVQELPGTPPPLVARGLKTVVAGCLWLTVALTLISGLGFVGRHWRVLRDAVTS